MKTHRTARGVIVAVLAPTTVLALAGCFSSPLIGSEPEMALIASGEYELIESLNVPHVRGADGCGAQALATVLAHGDDNVDAAQLAEELPWHDLGATPIDLLLAARSRGREARIASGSVSGGGA